MEHTLPYPLPLAEALRLQALQPYQFVNTMQDETFSELVRLAAKLFRVPISIVAFVEAEEVRFGLNYGLDRAIDRVNRWETLCSVAVLRSETSVFENLHDQPCDLINPTLVHQMHLGFYAGTALRTKEGFPIGVLCVLDQKARSFNQSEAKLLERLAAITMSLLDLRRQLLQQPCWNQQLWQSVYARIEPAITRLETLAAPTDWAQQETLATHTQQVAASEEIMHIISVMAEQIEVLSAAA